eukprot:503024-Rhodomonas_salina.5
MEAVDLSVEHGARVGDHEGTLLSLHLLPHTQTHTDIQTQRHVSEGRVTCWVEMSDEEEKRREAGRE